MGLPTDCLSSRLPRRFPVGAKYVVEGYGGEEGNLRLIVVAKRLPPRLGFSFAPSCRRAPAPPPRAASLFCNGLRRQFGLDPQHLVDMLLAPSLIAAAPFYFR